MVICFSGAVLVFEQEITHMLNPQVYQSESNVQSQPLPPSELAKRIIKQVGDSLSLNSLEIPGKEGCMAFASFNETGRKQLSVNPYTGVVNGYTVSYPFFQVMRKLHRWLMNPPASKGESSVGKLIVGISTMAMGVIIVSGIIIWIPRTLKGAKNRLRISVDKGWKRFWYDSHVSIGIYTAVFLLIMVLTGLTWSFRWYRNFAYGLFEGSETNAIAKTSYEGNSVHPDKGKKDVGVDFKIWDCVLTEVKKEYPKYESITLGYKEVKVRLSGASSLRKTDSVLFDTKSGKIVHIDRYDERPVSTKLKGLFYALHTGLWGGWVTKIIYFLSALAGSLFPLTGYYIWLRRKTVLAGYTREKNHER